MFSKGQFFEIHRIRYLTIGKGQRIYVLCPFLKALHFYFFSIAASLAKILWYFSGANLNSRS